MAKVKNSPKVSVIIPTYNRAHLIGRAIQSVLNQIYQDFEIIVVDDGSTDNTEGVIKEFQKKDERIRYIRHDKNKGGSAARNTGIKASGGEYIAFQDSDDEWFPEKLEKQMKVFATAPAEVGVVYTDMQRINEDGEIEYWHSPRILPEDGIIYKDALDYRVMNIGIQSAVIKKECFDKVGMFDERFPRFIDLELFIRLSKYYYFYHIDEPMVNFFLSGGFPLKKISSKEDAFTIARKLILGKYFEDIKKDRRLLAKHYYDISLNLYSNGEIKQGKRYLMKAVMAYPLNIKFFLLAFILLFGQDTYNKAIEIYRKIRTHGLKR